LPEQVSADWDNISPAIQGALPPLVPYGNPDIMNNILAKILEGELECWTLIKNEEETLGIGTFEVVLDVPSGVKSLLIYSLYTYIPFSYDLWGILLTRLRKHAREKGCHRISGFTNVDRVIDLVNVLGGRSDFRYIWLEV